jgi:hypothetical protein
VLVHNKTIKTWYQIGDEENTYDENHKVKGWLRGQLIEQFIGLTNVEKKKRVAYLYKGNQILLIRGR